MAAELGLCCPQDAGFEVREDIRVKDYGIFLSNIKVTNTLSISFYTHR